MVIMREMVGGRVEFSEMSSSERAVALEAVRLGLSLEDVRSMAGVKRWTVAEAAMRFIADKRETRGKSARYTADLTGRVRSITEAFGAKVMATVTAGDLDAWLRAKTKSPSHRATLRQALVTFWRWARMKEVVPDRTTAAERTTKPNPQKGSIGVLTPVQLRDVLRAVRADYLPWALLQSLAGIRTNELFPERYQSTGKDVLRWDDIDFEDPHIYIRDEVAKTGQSRVVPLLPVLAKWLAPIAGEGPICPRDEPSWYRRKGDKSVVQSVVEAAGLDYWPQNCLRHSYGSYRTAITQDIGKVSLEMGNSPSVVRRNYLKAQTPAVAKEWFALTPRKVGRPKLRLAQ